MEEKMLPKSYGVKFDFEIKTDTRSFDQVDTAAAKAGIKAAHLPSKPTMGQAIARAMLCLVRMCMSSIEFPGWSKHNHWEGKKSGDKRNPNYSLKITQVKAAKTDANTTWRVNIADAKRAGENMGHVLNVTYSPAFAGTINAVTFQPGTDKQAYADFGKEMMEIINAEYVRFLTHYNDEDLRRVFDSELEEMRALKIIKKTNAFIPRDYVDRARLLLQFAKDCDQKVSWLGLDNDEMTRDSLLADLKTVIFRDMEEYEAEMDAKLNAKEGSRKRGEAQRERMFNTANENIDRIYAQADYHAAVLGVMAEGIKERRDALKAKAAEFLTRDFSKNTGEPVLPSVSSGTVKTAEEAFE